jgi:sec-independent protein translocase protein TatB
MFDIGFSELALICVIALLVLGPERMPQALRTLGLWFGRMRRTFMTMKTEIEREIGMDEIRRQLHNEAVLDEIKRLERDVRGQSETPPNSPTTAASEHIAEVAEAVAPPVLEKTNGEANGISPQS